MPTKTLEASLPRYLGSRYSNASKGPVMDPPINTNPPPTDNEPLAQHPSNPSGRLLQPWTTDGYPIVNGKYRDLSTGELKTHVAGVECRPCPGRPAVGCRLLAEPAGDGPRRPVPRRLQGGRRRAGPHRVPGARRGVSAQGAVQNVLAECDKV